MIFMTSKRSTSCSLNSTTSNRLRSALNCFKSWESLWFKTRIIVAIWKDSHLNIFSILTKNWIATFFQRFNVSLKSFVIFWLNRLLMSILNSTWYKLIQCSSFSWDKNQSIYCTWNSFWILMQLAASWKWNDVHITTSCLQL